MKYDKNTLRVSCSIRDSRFSFIEIQDEWLMADNKKDYTDYKYYVMLLDGYYWSDYNTQGKSFLSLADIKEQLYLIEEFIVTK